jgi:hypothetical protein
MPPDTVTILPTFKLPTIPVPPDTVNAPLLGLVDVVLPLTTKFVSTVAFPYILVPDKSFAIFVFIWV